MGTLLKHKNQYQTFNRALAQPKSKWQSLGAILKHSWRSRIESRCHSQSASQHCTRLPWWHPQHSPLAPTPRIAAHSYRATSLPAGTEHHVVDLRSDTVTRPSPEMRQAMAQAEVGDDDYGEDPTVNELQNVTADLLGKEEALFVPTATMANLIAVMCHCRRRGAQLLLGRQAHIHVFEHGGVAQVAGVHSEILQDLPDGTINLDELEHKIQQSYGSQYHPRPELICLENTHCSAGGRVLPLQYLQEMRQLAHRYGLKIHLDGARVLNAAVALRVPPSHITQHCDSVSLCVSKGVGAPAGALLAGQREFIAEAWRMRKLLGGGMRQAGVLAAAALVGLRHMEETLQKDHNNARSFAEGVCSLGSSLCSVNLASVETNIVMMTTSASRLAPAKLCELMEAVSEEEVATTGQAISVRLFPWGEHLLRAVWHCDVSAHDTQLAGSKLRFVLDKWEQEHVHVY
ncbi:uncharacterized protein LOC132581262 isoform X1 [Heteronotia binoei]|uniref:uncharacterized protein LOC132581262 isoform X1 n=1 Tax=Heteronotia binoei TaxID=13085 RepID=UPI00293010A9|nr:uncharacterized protein LOC132581262 isoform X1 [Heteronotia binoei]